MLVRSKKPVRKAIKRSYRVFISHSGDDIWLACQIAAAVESVGAKTFLDVRDISHGSDFGKRINEEMPTCRELLALFTPWSRNRRWIAHEMGMADALKLRIVPIFYHVKIQDFPAEEGGLGPLNGISIVDINDLDTYLKALRRRVDP